VTAIPEPRRCEFCGDPLRRSNVYGICANPNKPECQRERWRRQREAQPKPERKHCDVCGDPLNSNNESGICGDHTKTACMRERKRREALRAGVAVHRIKISAGDTFSRWTALENYIPGRRLVLVRCECGNERGIDASRLVHGRSTSCGCSRRKPRPNKPPYLQAGTTVGRLTLLEDVTHSTGRASCLCECGTKKEVGALSLKHGNTRSCGCLRREIQTTHGFTGHPLYQTWRGMLQRCTNPNARSYRNYGGRNIPITVCDRWRDPWLFAEDIHREIGPRPEGRDEKGRALYELDRVNNDLGYRPGNVRWADRKTQRANQRTVAKLTCERDEAMHGQDALAAEVDRLTALLASLGCEVPAGGEFILS
jgi:hypothetical protein